MASFNRVIIGGNLTRDPEYKQLASGQAVCRLGLASNRQFKNRQTGDLVQEVCYVDIDVWGAQAESCRQYLQKGRPVLIEGRLKFQTWEDQSGQKRNKHSIVADRVVFLGTAQQEFVPAERAETEQQQKQQLDPTNPVEKELIDQIEDIKAKTKAKQAPSADSPADMKVAPETAQKQPTTGDINFKDEPPFQDDLPF